MGYERNDRRDGRDQDQDRDRYGRGRSYGREQGYGPDRYGSSDYGWSSYASRDRDYGRQPQGYDYDERGFFDRAGDEVRSWFGDEEAEQRRRRDERAAEREYQRSGGSYGGGDRPRDRSYADPAVYAGARGSARRAGGFGSGTGIGTGDGAGDYGAGSGAGATGMWGVGAGNERADWGRDPSYRSWRDRQLAEFDRDYDDYRREHQSKFDSEFHSWRTTRQGQRQSLNKVQEHQEVVGADGQHVGKVDKVRGDRIILTKSDQDAGGHHHSIPVAWIQSVDDRVTIAKTADEAKAHWKDEERNSAIGSGGSEHSDANGPHNLDRSFSGTY